MTRRALSWLLGLVVLGCGAPPRPAAERSQITAGPRRFVRRPCRSVGSETRTAVRTGSFRGGPTSLKSEYAGGQQTADGSARPE